MALRAFSANGPLNRIDPDGRAWAPGTGYPFGPDVDTPGDRELFDYQKCVLRFVAEDIDLYLQVGAKRWSWSHDAFREDFINSTLEQSLSLNWSVYGRDAYTYFASRYSNLSDWVVVGWLPRSAVGWNLPWMITKPRILRARLSEETGIATLLHEPQHDWAQLGGGHNWFGVDWGKAIDGSVVAGLQLLRTSAPHNKCCRNIKMTSRLQEITCLCNEQAYGIAQP